MGSNKYIGIKIGSETRFMLIGINGIMMH